MHQPTTLLEQGIRSGPALSTPDFDRPRLFRVVMAANARYPRLRELRDMTSPGATTDATLAGVRGLFRVALPDGSIRLAVGDTRSGPSELLAPDRTIADILRAGRRGLSDAVAGQTTGLVPTGSRILAPLDAQEVWAAG